MSIYEPVVNCFQILAILGLETTLFLSEVRHKGCELLSNFGYIGIGNNICHFDLFCRKVVNCFQILAILGLETTFRRRWALSKGCELLSNFGYIGIGNNFPSLMGNDHPVVNCFQILAILGLETT